MHFYNVQVTETDIKVASIGPGLVGKAEIFKTTGRDDPRIIEAIQRCWEKGIRVERIDLPSHHSQVFNRG